MKYQLYTKNVNPDHTDLTDIFVNTKIAVIKDKDIVRRYVEFLDSINYEHNKFYIKALSDRTHTLYTLDMKEISTDAENFICIKVIDVKYNVPNSQFDTELK